MNEILKLPTSTNSHLEKEKIYVAADHLKNPHFLAKMKANVA